MLILDEDSSVGSAGPEQEGKMEQDDMGQSGSGHNDDKAEVQETENEVQQKQGDDIEETETDKDEEDGFSGQFNDEDYEGIVFV